MNSSDSVVMEIVQTLAETNNNKPQELECQLANYIDPDAIETLVDHEDTTWTLSFRFPGQTVVITSGDNTTVESVPDRRDQTPETNSDTLKHCSRCGTSFERDTSNSEDGYKLLGEGDTLLLVKCANCDAEQPVSAEPSPEEIDRQVGDPQSLVHWTREQTGRVTWYTHHLSEIRVSILELYGSVPRTARPETRPTDEPVYVVRKHHPSSENPVHICTTDEFTTAKSHVYDVMVETEARK